MITNPQDELGSDVSIMSTLARINGEQFGVYADVLSAGTIRCGDIVALANDATE
jgi:MOSC domain-containing protein YiiM